MRAVLLWAAVFAAVALPCARSQQHAFSVKDDISMTRINFPFVQPHVPGSEIAWPSPDGRQIAVVTSRGILSTDKIESKILAFDLDGIKKAFAKENRPLPEPHVLATIRSVPTAIETDAYAPVIKDLRWSSDGSSLYFRATNLSGNYQLCVVNRDGSGFSRLTPADKSVDRFDIERDRIVYNAADPGAPVTATGEAINRDAVNITGARLQYVLFPNDVSSRAHKVFRLYTLSLRTYGYVPHQVPDYSLEEIPYLTSFYPFHISPTRKLLAKLEPAASVPDRWSVYEPTAGLEHLRLTNGRDPRLMRSDNLLRPLQYTLINLETGQRTPLFDAPNARSLGYGLDANRIAWSRDSRRMLVTNTFLPASQPNSTSVAPLPCSVASVDLPSGKIRCLAQEVGAIDLNAPHVQDVAFTDDSREAIVLLRNGQGKQTVRKYQLRDETWSLESTETLNRPAASAAELNASQDEEAPLTIYVDQSLNDPPALWARDDSGHKREVWDPNPQFSEIRFGQASPYEWKDKDGRDWAGILVKPIDYREGRRYPLVVQMYDFVDGQFLTDGLYPTAFAARELASVGFVVLQIRKRRDTVSEEDTRIHLEGYRSAIRSLSAAGMINPAKVGVVGFSWTCWYVAHAIVEDPSLFSVATIADGLDNSYMQYKLFTPGDYLLEQQMTKIRNGPPFGAGLAHWMESAPGFRADRIEAPLRIEAIGHSSVLSEWEIYSSLRLLGRPVDLIYFPNGSHIHELPLERLESQQGNIDWLRFWLKDEEDPDPSKHAQYQRWETMRDGKGQATPD
jgi:dipeptidyl aminopeptidase/acylaminoacyl peptidase